MFPTQVELDDAAPQLEVVSRGTRGTLEYTTRSHRQRRLSERVAASTEEMGMTLGDSSVDCLTTIGGHLFSPHKDHGFWSQPSWNGVADAVEQLEIRKNGHAFADLRARNVLCEDQMDDSAAERSASFGSVETMVFEGAFIDRGDDDGAPHLFLPQRAWHEHSHDEGDVYGRPPQDSFPTWGTDPHRRLCQVEDADDPSERRHEFTQHEMMITAPPAGVLMHPHSDALEAEMEEAVTWGSHEDADAEEREDPSRNPLSALRHGADPRRSLPVPLAEEAALTTASVVDSIFSRMAVVEHLRPATAPPALHLPWRLQPQSAASPLPPLGATAAVAPPLPVAPPATPLPLTASATPPCGATVVAPLSTATPPPFAKRAIVPFTPSIAACVGGDGGAGDGGSGAGSSRSTTSTITHSATEMRQRKLSSVLERARNSIARAETFFSESNQVIATTREAIARAQAGVRSEPAATPEPLVPVPPSLGSNGVQAPSAPHHGFRAAALLAPGSDARRQLSFPQSARSTAGASLMQPGATRPASSMAAFRSPRSTIALTPVPGASSGLSQTVARMHRRSPNSVLPHGLLPPSLEPSPPGPSAAPDHDATPHPADARRVGGRAPTRTQKAELAPGDYRLSGVNVDTKELHEYELDGTCTLHGDGTLSGEAQEKSTVWSRPAVYRMTCGTWTPGGGLTFHLEHSDYRRGLFDPFVFHLDLRVAASTTRRGRTAVERDDEEDRMDEWEAVSGWWKTGDNDEESDHTDADRQCRRPVYSGSFGRIRHLRMIRI